MRQNASSYTTSVINYNQHQERNVFNPMGYSFSRKIIKILYKFKKNIKSIECLNLFFEFIFNFNFL